MSKTFRNRKNGHSKPIEGGFNRLAIQRPTNMITTETINLFSVSNFMKPNWPHVLLKPFG